MNDWLRFLAAFPQPGELHVWLLSQRNYLGVYALQQQQEQDRSPRMRPFVHPCVHRRSASLETPYRLPLRVENPALHRLITLPSVGNRPVAFIPGFGHTPCMVLRGGEEISACLPSACSAVGLVMQPAVNGHCVRIFNYRKRWFASAGQHIATQRQPVATIPAPLRKLLTVLSTVLLERGVVGTSTHKDTNNTKEGHTSVFWQECTRHLDPERAWYFHVTDDGFFFTGSYPIITCDKPALLCTTVSCNNTSLLLSEVLPRRMAGSDGDNNGNSLGYGRHIGTVIFNPVTLAAVIVTQQHNLFLLHRWIRGKEPIKVTLARLMFLTRMLRPLRPDLVDTDTQGWITSIVTSFLDNHAKQEWPELCQRLMDLVDQLFTYTVPTWVAQTQDNLPPWAYPLLAAISRPNREHWLPLWEGALWVQMLASMCD